MKKSILALLVLTVFCFLSCERQELGEAVPAGSCSQTGAFVRKNKDVAGVVLYDSTNKSYKIQVVTSFDSADIGITCNLPAEYQENFLKVRFSGNYYEYDKPAVLPVGYRIYYLTVESISK